MDTTLENMQSITHSKIANTFTIEEFKKTVDGMIATNDRAYSSAWALGARSTDRRYTPEQIKHIIENGTPEQKAALSMDFFKTDGFYRRINIYYATLLQYKGLLVPNQKKSKKLSSIQETKYYGALDFVEKMNLPVLCTDWAIKALVYGCYYGLILEIDKEHFAYIDLPYKYCITRYKDLEGNNIIEFDLSYFDSIVDRTMRLAALEAYPKDIAKAYKKWKRTGKIEHRWYKIMGGAGICIPFFEGGPFFLNTIPEIANYDAYKDLEREKDEDEIKKVLIQQVPHLADGTLLFQPVEAEEMHRGAVNMMKKNGNISVLTTYADVEIENSNTTTDSAKYNNLDKIVQTVYRNAGVSAELFAATGNMSLSISINNDVAMMMWFASKMAKIISNVVNSAFSSRDLWFKYTFLPISFYNIKDFVDYGIRQSQLGYSYFIPPLAIGLTQRDIESLKDLENTLGLREKLIPLSTSYTQSGTIAGRRAGRPALQDSEKSDKTIANERSLDAGSSGSSGTSGESGGSE